LISSINAIIILQPGFQMSIKRLSEIVINQIAAGEVIERPASVIKELVENAIDSGADRIEIFTVAGGKSLIRVTDNGRGMGREDLALSVERHCTSKLGEDLFDIQALGFRGEALPSIGAVSRMTIKSRALNNENSGWEISVQGGKLSSVKPAALSEGTIVEVADLFYATPARLKFLKSDRAESNAITEIVKRTIIAFPHIRFTLSGPDRATLEFPATKGDDAALKRIAQVLGQAFFDNALAIDAERENVRLTGFAGLPTFNRGNAQHQFVFVNGRPVRDKVLWGAIRAAYMDFLARNRHPILALFLQIDPHYVDVNVHPAKADVRFRDPGLVRGLIVGALKQAITNSGHRASTHNATDMMGAFTAPEFGNSNSASSGGNQHYANKHQGAVNANYNWQASPNHPGNIPDSVNGGFSEQSQPEITDMPVQSADLRANFQNISDGSEALPLGSPRAQVHKNYIVSQTNDGLVIVDQHAAHERLVYEALKQALSSKAIASQMLLIPEIIDMPEEDVDRLMAYAEPFEQLGLKVERFGPGAVAVRETPSMLGEINAGDLVRNLVDDIAEWGTADTLKDRLDYVAATMACHGSVRSGRILRAEEMDALLRQMEATPNSGQCNHGRPTYVELKLKDIERLFGRR
jgi:DNA mismatch repair protein MutL